MRRLFFLLSLMVLGIVCLPMAQAGIVQDGLVANWSFDQSTVVGDTVNDLASNYNITMKDNPKIVPGRHGEAIEFDGTKSYVELTKMEGFGPQLNTFSLDFWIKTPKTEDWTTLFKTLNDGVTTGIGIDLNRTAKPSWLYLEGNTHFYVRGESGNALAPEIQADIYDDKWHHIAWVVEDTANNITQVYVDGKPEEMVMVYEQNPDTFVDFTFPVYLGAANNRGNIECFCPAVVDEFRFYTKGLSEAEVIRNMESGAAVDAYNKLPYKWGEIKSLAQ